MAVEPPRLDVTGSSLVPIAPSTKRNADINLAGEVAPDEAL